MALRKLVSAIHIMYVCMYGERYVGRKWWIFRLVVQLSTIPPHLLLLFHNLTVSSCHVLPSRIGRGCVQSGVAEAHWVWLYVCTKLNAVVLDWVSS